MFLAGVEPVEQIEFHESLQFIYQHVQNLFALTLTISISLVFAHIFHSLLFVFLSMSEKKRLFTLQKINMAHFASIPDGLERIDNQKQKRQVLTDWAGFEP